METSRQTILDILRRHRQRTVSELTKELGLAPATVRRHLDILARDGYVDFGQVRRRTGRPHYVFSLSEAGEDLFPKHYVRITNRLIEEIVALTPEETAGQSGTNLAELVFGRMSKRLAERIQRRVQGETFTERGAATQEALAEEGIAFEAEWKGDTCVLVGHGCPCPRVADSNNQMCAHDQRLLSLLLDADVTYVEPESVGQDAYCAYQVRERPDGQAKEHLSGTQPLV